MGSRGKRSKPMLLESLESTQLSRQGSGKGALNKLPQETACTSISLTSDQVRSQLLAQTTSSVPLRRNEPSVKESSTNHDNRQFNAKRDSSLLIPWYGKTWPRIPKSLAITQLAKESVSAAGIGVTELGADTSTRNPLRPSTPGKSSAAVFTRNIGRSNLASPLDAMTTKVNVFPECPNQSPGPKYDDTMEITSQETCHPESSRASSLVTSGPTADGRWVEPSLETESAFPELQTSPDFGWLSWLPRIGYTPKGNTNSSPTGREGIAVSRKKHGIPSVEQSHSSLDPKNLSSPLAKISDAGPVAAVSSAGPRRSWLTFRNTTSNDQLVPEDHGIMSASTLSVKKVVKAPADSVLGAHDEIPPKQNGNMGGWAFWSRPNPPKDGSRDRQYVGDNSVKSPTIEPTSEGQSLIKENQLSLTSQSSPKDTPVSRGMLPNNAVQPVSTVSNIFTENRRSGAAAAVKAGPSKNHQSLAEVPLPSPSASGPTNIVLPRLKETFGANETSGWIQSFSRYLTYNKTPAPTHVNITQDAPRVRKAIAIGIHGYFPAPLLRSILGQPTGTSIKFADMAESAIQRFTNRHGYSCDIAKVALEGEGKIEERVDLLWKLMLNWLDDIRQADLIFIACHSQGCPIAIILLAKLILFGCINSARVGVCAMAGINLGPFSEYKSRWMSGSAAGELFEFAKPESAVSSDYNAALRTVLSFGAKICFIGSIDDQLVSMESSTFGPVKHPHIYRAVFVNGRVHAPDFLTHLVGFALKLRNLGVSDHGLIRELSSPLAGSLYGGEGHSKLYEEPAVYDLTVEYALETTSLSSIDLENNRRQSFTSQNPYILPFSMRGILEEDFVRANLREELSVLLNQFDDWKPSTKVLKDVKFRLEGIRSKL